MVFALPVGDILGCLSEVVPILHLLQQSLTLGYNAKKKDTITLLMCTQREILQNDLLHSAKLQLLFFSTCHMTLAEKTATGDWRSFFSFRYFLLFFPRFIFSSGLIEICFPLSTDFCQIRAYIRTKFCENRVVFYVSKFPFVSQEIQRI